MTTGLRRLDRAHAAVTRVRLLQMFTAVTRILLAVAFIPPSIPKILHRPFTVLPESHPVGHYFAALLRTGFYYEFIGWGQILAAVLLLFPRTAHLGALLFLPIVANIAVLTAAVDFAGTKYITALMLLAAVYLNAWEWDRLRTLFVRRGATADRAVPAWWTFTSVFAGCGVLAATVFVTLGVGNLHRRPVGTFVGLVIAGALFGAVCWLHYRSMRTGSLDSAREGEGDIVA